MGSQLRVGEPKVLARVVAAARLRTALAFAAAGFVLVATLAVPAVHTARAEDVVVHVALTGVDTNPGTADLPVRTIVRAVKIAPAGATVTIHAGSYHESVQVYRKQIALVAAPGERVVLDGAAPVESWQATDGLWVAPWTVSWPVTNDATISPTDPMAAYPDLAFLDGVPLRQVATREEVVTGTFFVDDAADSLWIADDPTGRLVEASDLAWGIYLNGADGSSISGVTVRRYATTRASFAAVRLFADRLSMTSSTVELNASRGVSVIGTDVRLDKLMVRDNGFIGIHGDRSLRVTLLRSSVLRNNAERFSTSHSGAGVKFTGTTRLRVRANHVADNHGTGVWTDLGAVQAVIDNNLIERNERSGVLIEVSGYSTVVGNVVRDNAAGGVKVLESNDVEVWNNALYGNQRNIWVQDGPRETDVDPRRTAQARWDLIRVNLRNNIVGPGAATSTAVFFVDDWTERRSAASMRVTSDFAAYWMPTGATPTLSRWANWPEPFGVGTTLEVHRIVSGHDAASVGSTEPIDPFARDAARLDYRVAGALVGTPATRRVAALLGTVEGGELPIGPVAVLRPGPRITGVSVTRP